MRQAFDGKEYGFFFHFLKPYDDNFPWHKPLTEPRADEWNEMVDTFNAEKIAWQMHELKAGYVFLTTGQNSGYYCSPNSVYDRIVAPGYCSNRDLISDFADALAEYGIDCYVYSTTQAAFYSPRAMINLKAVPPWSCNMHVGNYADVKYLQTDDPRLKFYLTAWEDIHREWAERWGKKIKGWWIDGCYYPEKYYDFPDAPNGHSFCRALRAGNPDAVVAFNPGVMRPCRNYPHSDEDYTAGETSEPMLDVLESKITDGLRYQILTFTGEAWGGAKLRTDGKGFAMMTRNIVDNGGVVTWDVFFDRKNGIPENNFAVLKEFADCYQKTKKIFPPCSFHFTPPGENGEGKIEFCSEQNFEVNVTWNNTTRKMQIPGSISLPFEEPGEHLLVMECNGFEKKNIFYGNAPEYNLGLNRTISFSAENAEYKLTRKTDGLLVHCRITEKESLPASLRTPWNGSSLEIFLTEKGTSGDLFQYGLLASGETVQIFPEFREMPELAKTPFGRTADGWEHEVLIPVPESGKFFFEIVQHINDAGRLKNNCLFGGPASGYGKYNIFAKFTLM